jgi:hypothetical protein
MLAGSLGWNPPDARETTTHFSSRKKGGAAADALFRGVHLSHEKRLPHQRNVALCSLWLNLHLIIRGGAAPLFRPPARPT